jgi:membrane fusion protein, multidrug efflux system
MSKMKTKGICWMMTIVAVSMTGCNKTTQIENDVTETVSVSVQKVESSPVSEDIKVSGNITGYKTVRMGFLVAGKVNYIAVHEGETIHAGELLASLDPESYEIALEMADANLSQMQDDYKRIKELYDRNSVTESDYVKITNGLRATKAQRRLHVKNLEDTRLYAPITGVLLKRGIEEGEITDKGMPVFGVSDIYKVKAIASIPEMELRYIKLGDRAGVYIPSLDSGFFGRIVEIGTLAEPSTRTFDVKIELNNPDLLIRPGMTAEVSIKTGISKDYFSIPANAILHDVNNASYVFVADTFRKQAFKRNVSLGKIVGDNIEIVSGLNRDELVILSGQNKLSNGTQINVK